jgi:hypothetical protein
MINNGRNNRWKHHKESDEIGQSAVAALHGGCVSIILERKLKKKLCVYGYMAY